ncbi:MAG TPA: glycosyltransferase family 9 protein [Calditrichia bacterium]|nr:glycosyltransferase family 9 protein [Calditrichia bacterium]
MPNPTQSPGNILICRTDRIGDVVLTTPASTALKAHFPDCRITFLVRDYTRPLVAQHRHIDHILTYDPEGRHRGIAGHLRLAQELRDQNFDWAIMSRPRPAIAAVLWFSGIPNRVGIGYRWYSLFLNRRIFEHRRDGARHETDYNLSFLKPLIGETLPEVRFDFNLAANLVSWREQWLRNRDISTPYVIVHPGSGGSAPNLTPTQYRFLLKGILQQTECRILVTGSAAERELGDEIIGDFEGERVRNLCGELDLPELMSVIAGASLFMASSTGPFHIANAFGVPVLGFYCPIAPYAPSRWGPYHQQEWVLTQSVQSCSHSDKDGFASGSCLTELEDARLGEMLEKRLKDLGLLRVD